MIATFYLALYYLMSFHVSSDTSLSLEVGNKRSAKGFPREKFTSFYSPDFSTKADNGPSNPQNLSTNASQIGQQKDNVLINTPTQKTRAVQNTISITQLPEMVKNQTGKTHVYLDTNEYFKKWAKTVVTDCGGNFIGYGSSFVHFKNLLLDKALAISSLKGGELIENVMNQNSEAESYDIHQGFQKVHCSQRPRLAFSPKMEHLKKWWETTVFTDEDDVKDWVSKGAVMNRKFTLLLTRYEYANVYWTVMDLYNTFLMAR